MTESISNVHWQDSIPVYEKDTKDFFNIICKAIAIIQSSIKNVRETLALVPPKEAKGCADQLNAIDEKAVMILKLCSSEQVRNYWQINMLRDVIKDVELQMDKHIHSMCEHMKQVAPAKTNDILVNVIRFENNARALSNQIGFTCSQPQPPT